MKQLLLYTTEGCHLCEQAAALIAPHLPEGRVVLVAVEISESDALVSRYGVRIPVLRFSDGEQELSWPFDEPSLLRFLARHV